MCSQSIAGHQTSVPPVPRAHRPALAGPASDESRDPGDLSGQELGARYRLVRPLGRRVTLYRARRRIFGEPVLIRVLPGARAGEPARRFLAEADAAARLHHGHIVHVTDYGVDQLADGASVAYMAMEHLRGENLVTTLARQGPLHWTRVLAIARQVCRALIAAHDRGIVHGNLKPANCFRVARRDTPDFIKLLDFGITGFSAGTCPATPEGRAADLHALGLLMYRLLTDRVPQCPPTSLRQDFPTLEISPAFEAVVLATLARDPCERPTCARALYRSLLAAEAPAPTATDERAASLDGPPPAAEVERAREADAAGEAPPVEAAVEAAVDPASSQTHVTEAATTAHSLVGVSTGSRTLSFAGLDDPAWPAWAVWCALGLWAVIVVQAAVRAL